ncbi:hypothetical protein COT48_01530 [Candidatus Woesearchaeota archaeon CG08_land_8_20_14_0_20_47_9]|nr:MAG: hypothetical protein AUJ69_04540 [Candidatus Woesearchaeota archaeon CG1_02_47_18]PIO04217.1 MAG: hypothetical protein COT48_01530 [Candidatus Woesearchaeota archaeon CG08_land_8_20_14_0_20_47_9]HII29800.1 hypothetical protein [Candidatus Woesearchaeota archaeon]
MKKLFVYDLPLYDDVVKALKERGFRVMSYLGKVPISGTVTEINCGELIEKGGMYFNLYKSKINLYKSKIKGEIEEVSVLIIEVSETKVNWLDGILKSLGIKLTRRSDLEEEVRTRG